MGKQTGSISFEATGGFNSYAKQNYATLSQIKGQFATSTTGANTAAKVATIVPSNTGWGLYPGATVTVKFSNANSATGTLTLNVNGSGAKEIRDYNGNNLEQAARAWPEGAAMALTYDGTYWRIQDSNLMERMYSAETRITQTADNISLNVSESYIKTQSRGEQLVTNGSGVLGNNTNFSMWTYDPTVSMNGSSGSFTSPKEKANRNYVIDEKFPVNTAEQYLFSFDVKAETDDAELPILYSYIAVYDIDKQNIDHNHVHYKAGTMTTLAQELKAGDTKVYLTNIDSNFTYDGSRKGLTFWDYVNHSGYAYPVGEYSRHAYPNLYSAQSQIDSEANTVTLNSPWNGPTYPAGTPVSQNQGGSSYIYVAASNLRVTSDVMHREGTIGPGYVDATVSETDPKKFRKGTAYASIGFLWNYQAKSDAQIWITNVNFRRYTSSHLDLEAAKAEIKVTTDDISLEVEKKTDKESIISTIRQSAEEVKIRAEQVEIDGTAIFSEIDDDVEAAILDKGYSTTSQTLVRTQRIYYRSDDDIASPPAPAEWIDFSDTANSTWSTKRMSYDSSYPYLFTCVQMQDATDEISYTDILLDNTTTVIDGGKIITNSITADKITTENIVSSNGKSWINLHDGTFNYAHEESGEGISWDGEHLQVSGDITVSYENIKNAPTSIAQFVDAENYITSEKLSSDILQPINKDIDDLGKNLSNLGTAIDTKIADSERGLNATISSVDSKVGTLSTQVSDNASKISANTSGLNTANTNITNLQRTTNEHSEQLTSIRSFTTIEPGKVTLGLAGSPVQTFLTTEGLTFQAIGQTDPIAYLGVDEKGVGKLFVTNAVVVQDIELGDWAWTTRKNKHLTLKYIGS